MQGCQQNEYSDVSLTKLEFLRDLVLVLREKDRSENLVLAREAKLIASELKRREHLTRNLLAQLPSPIPLR